jgi:transport and Golgi organization protein 2
MCTLSWLRHDQGFAVLFNRDERRTRRAGLPPEEQMRGGVRFLAPVDPEGGGSWAAVNDRRIALCILNQYDKGRDLVAGPVSRGQLLLGLAHLSSQAEVWQEVRTAGLMQYAPFRLAVFEPGLPALILSWDGAGLTDRIEGQSGLLATSSSLVQEEAELSRRELFDQALQGGMVDEAAFDQLHRSHLPEKGALSICMHREDAVTVSLTRLVVERTSVRLGYVGGSPCEGAVEVTRVLEVAG